MTRARLPVFVLAAACLVPMSAIPQPAPNTKPKIPPPKTAPRLVPVAETKLLMEGLTHPNFQGIEKILKADSIEPESWTIARGQAILIAEAGNLLMMRPPNNSGQDSWMKHSSELREAADRVARTISTRDTARSRTSVSQLANSCNSCHQSFRVTTRITAFEVEKP